VELYLYPQYVFMAWCLFKHRENFTLLLHLHIPSGLFPSDLLTIILYAFLMSPCTTHLFLLDLVALMMMLVYIIFSIFLLLLLFHSSQYSLNAPVLKTPSVCVLPTRWGQVSQSYKITVKITILYILIFIC